MVPESDRASRWPCDTKCHILACLVVAGQKQHMEMYPQWLVANIIPPRGTGPCRAKGTLFLINSG